MSKPAIHRLGNLQLKIMQILWAQHPATVGDVHARLQEDTDLAYTTVATMLRKMESRGLVQHQTEGRTFFYSPAVEADAVTRGMADDLLERLFGGSLSAMVNHLLTRREVSRDELATIEKLISARKRNK